MAELRRASIHQRAARLEENAHLFVRGRRERFESGIVFGTLPPLRMLREVGVIERVMLRVKKTLPHRRDHAHERTGKRAVVAVVRLEGDVLENIRLEQRAIRIFSGQGNKRAGAANDSLRGRKDGDGEAKFAQRCQRFFLRRKIPRGAKLRRDGTKRVAGAGLAGIRFGAGRAIKFVAARRHRGLPDRHRVAGGNRRVGGIQHEVRLNKTGVDRLAFHVPDARVVRHGAVRADGLDQAVADDDDARVENFTGLNDHLAAYQRMNPRRQRMKTRRPKFAGEGGIKQARRRQRAEKNHTS